MLGTLYLLVSATAALAASAPSNDRFNPSAYAADDIIERDFAIIGGGAAGTYAAISLADQNHTFTLIEITDRLGGNTRTFSDPSTGANVDFGVQFHLDTPVVREFFNRLNTALAPVDIEYFGISEYYDFTNRIALANYTRGSFGPDYVAELDRHPYTRDLAELPHPVPEDLLLTWPEYAQSHNLSSGSTDGGFALPATPGEPLDTLALHTFNQGGHVLLAEFAGAAVHETTYNNSALYVNALAELRQNVSLQSSIVAARRSASRKSGVQLIATTPAGRKLIRAKQLLIAMPPVLDNANPLGLDRREYDILSRLEGKHYYGGVVNNTGLEPNVAYTNAGVDRPYHVPHLPGVNELSPSATPGYHFYWYNSVEAQSQEEVERTVRRTIQWLQTQSNITDAPEPNFLDYEDYYPYRPVPSAEDIADGWYGNMAGLQGHRNTWYISSIFVAGSTQVWNSTLNLLPEIIGAAAQG
ncbi:putative FAD dependent oxidoreductase [Aspergillus crustosus]